MEIAESIVHDESRRRAEEEALAALLGVSVRTVERDRRAVELVKWPA